MSFRNGKEIALEIHPCSLKSLRMLMNIHFKNLEQYDTFKSLGGDEQNRILGAEEICL